MGMIVANKWMRAGYGTKVRDFLRRVARPIEVMPDDVVIYDGEGYDVLKKFLRQQGVRHVLVAGYHADMCVCKTTAGYQNLAKDFNVLYDYLGGGYGVASDLRQCAQSREHQLVDSHVHDYEDGRQPKGRGQSNQLTKPWPPAGTRRHQSGPAIRGTGRCGATARRTRRDSRRAQS